MKRQLLAAAMAACILFSASAQGVKSGGPDSAPGGDTGAGTATRYEAGETTRTMDRLQLKTEERDRIRSMLQEQEGELARVRAELREMQARMARLMLEERVNRADVEQTLRKSMELEFRMRMIQADRQIRLKEMLGAERWAALYRLMQMAQTAERAGKLEDLISKSDNPAQVRLLFQMLKDLY